MLTMQVGGLQTLTRPRLGKGSGDEGTQGTWEKSIQRELGLEVETGGREQQNPISSVR